MSQYLLLRDNKQSGPYSFEDLTAKGLKGYDLIWIEGKSAAWRYPSEIPEFKPFAPVVEEQPYDRFYKKQDHRKQVSSNTENSASITGRTNNSANTAVRTNLSNSVSSSEPIQQAKKTVSVPGTNRRVVVILPGGMNAEKAAERPVVNEPVENKIIPAEKKVSTNSVSTPPKEPVNTNPNKVATSYDTTLVEFDRQSAPSRPAREKARSRSASSIPKLFAGTLVVLTIGVLIGWGFSRTITEKPASPAITPREVVEIPESQSVYNNESMLSVNNEVAEGETLPTDENAISDISQASIDSAAAVSSMSATPAIQKKPVTKPKKQAGELAAQQPVTPVIQQAEHASNPISTNNAIEDDAEKKTAKKNINELIKVTRSDFKIGAFGGISNLQLKVTNNSPYPVDLVVVEVKYLLANKKEFKSEKIYFKNLSAGETVSQEAPKSSRGIEVTSKLSLITSKALGMYQASL